MEDELEQANTFEGGVLVGYDGSQAARTAVEFAARIAHRTGWTLHVLRAWTMTTAPRPASMTAGYVPPVDEFGEATLQQLETDRQSWELPDGLDVQLHVAQGQSSARLLTAAEGAEMLVVGARGAGGFRGLRFGSTADQVVRNAPCPVVVVPPPKD